MSGYRFVQLYNTIPHGSGEYCLNHKTRLTFPLCLAQGETETDSGPSCYVTEGLGSLGTGELNSVHPTSLEDEMKLCQLSLCLLSRQDLTCPSRFLVRDICLPVKSVFISACE